MLTHGSEVITTLNKNNEWYAIVIAGIVLADIKTLPPGESRADAMRMGNAEAARLRNERESIVRGAKNAS